jgi:hypothetical protein
MTITRKAGESRQGAQELSKFIGIIRLPHPTFAEGHVESHSAFSRLSHRFPVRPLIVVMSALTPKADIGAVLIRQLVVRNRYGLIPIFCGGTFSEKYKQIKMRKIWLVGAQGLEPWTR